MSSVLLRVEAKSSEMQHALDDLETALVDVEAVSVVAVSGVVKSRKSTMLNALHGSAGRGAPFELCPNPCDHDQAVAHQPGAMFAPTLLSRADGSHWLTVEIDLDPRAYRNPCNYLWMCRIARSISSILIFSVQDYVVDQWGPISVAFLGDPEFEPMNRPVLVCHAPSPLSTGLDSSQTRLVDRNFSRLRFAQAKGVSDAVNVMTKLWNETAPVKTMRPAYLVGLIRRLCELANNNRDGPPRPLVGLDVGVHVAADMVLAAGKQLVTQCRERVKQDIQSQSQRNWAWLDKEMGVAAQAVLRAIDASVDLFWHADDGLVLQSNLQETIYGCSDLLHVTAFSRYCRDINAAAGVCMRRAVRHERKRALKQTELTHQVLLVHVGGLQRNKETRMHLLHEWSLPGFKDKMVLRALLQWKDPAGTPEFPPAEPPALEETWAPLQPTTQGTQAVACQTESDSEAEQTAMRLEALEGLVECLWGRSAILEPVASKREAVIDYFGLLHWYNVKIIEPLKGLLFSGRFRGQRKMAEVQRRADQLAERLADETSRRVLSEWQLSYILGESEDSNSYSRNSSSADLELCRNFAARELTGVKQTKRLERVRSTLSDASQWKSQAVSERRDAVAAQTDLISAQSEVRRLECEVVNECATLKERIERERSMRMAAECASHRYKQQVGKWVQQLEDAERAKATVHAELVNAQGNVDKLSTQLTEVAAALGQHKDSRKKIFKELSPDVMQRLAEMSR